MSNWSYIIVYYKEKFGLLKGTSNRRGWDVENGRRGCLYLEKKWYVFAENSALWSILKLFLKVCWVDLQVSDHPRTNFIIISYY